MKISTLFYVIGQGFKNIWRNKMFSLASIATMSACIFLFGIFYSIGTNFTAMVKSAEEGVAITVFFNEGFLNESTRAEFENELNKRPEIARYNYVSAEEAWETFKVEYFKGKEELAEGFADDNPLANSDNYEIYLNDVSMQSTLVSFLEGTEGVRQVNKSEVAAETLADMNSLVAVVFLGVVIILLAVAVFLISNTIATGITVRKEEIAIMKLIGAKDMLVRGPFVIEGVVIGFIGSVIPMVLLYFLYEKVITYVAETFNFLSSMISFLPVEDIFNNLIPVSLILGVGIGLVGSRITIHRHLRV